MRAEGLEALFERHRRLAEYMRQGLAELDLRLLADPRFASPTVTTAYVPDSVDAKALLATLEEQYNIVLAGGQGRLDGKIIRIGHMGWVQQSDLSAVLDALKIELNSARTPSASGAQTAR
jgi:aspartate aminotransferase-like enzyme